MQLNFPHLLQSYYFSFDNLQRAKHLANYISSFYPLHNQVRIELGLNELFLNAIEHGHLGINDEFKSQLKKTQQWEKEIHERLDKLENKSVEIFLEITPAYILLKIKDQGEGFDWLQYQKHIEKPSHDVCGRGLILVQAYCFDKVEFSNKGNEVSCITYRT